MQPVNVLGHHGQQFSGVLQVNNARWAAFGLASRMAGQDSSL